jgi:hypothetical protein
VSSFERGQRYTRAEVATLIALPGHRRSGGNWTTGYDSWDGEAFIFCNVGTTGRTGHDYPNRWIGDELEWHGKTNSHREQAAIRRMLDGGTNVHIFWRSDDREPFEYAGKGKPAKVFDCVPVKVHWRFD